MNNSKWAALLLILTILAYMFGISQNELSLNQTNDTIFNQTKKNFPNQKDQKYKQQTQFKTFKNLISDAVFSISENIQYFFKNQIWSFFLKNSSNHVSKPVNYKDNFASASGGAQILMISSNKIMSSKSILDSNSDTYLYTDEPLPITIVIGLNQQVMLDTFELKSSQVYSRITKDFILQGSFSIGQNTEWIFLGNLTAQNSFKNQAFKLEHTIIKYLKLTIVSSYGHWKYFSLTQIRVFGQGLFTHALQTLVEANTKQRQAQKKQIIKSQFEENITSQMLEEKLQNLVQESMQQFETQAHTLVYNLINHQVPFALPDQVLELQKKSKQQKSLKKKDHLENIELIEFQQEVQDLQSKIKTLEKINQKLKSQMNELRNLYLTKLQSFKPETPYQDIQFYMITFSFITSFICVIVLVMIQHTRKKQAKVIQQKKREMYKQIALQKVALIMKSSSLFKQFAQQQKNQ